MSYVVGTCNATQRKPLLRLRRVCEVWKLVFTNSVAYYESSMLDMFLSLLTLVLSDWCFPTGQCCR